MRIIYQPDGTCGRLSAHGAFPNVRAVVQRSDCGDPIDGNAAILRVSPPPTGHHHPPRRLSGAAALSPNLGGEDLL